MGLGAEQIQILRSITTLRKDIDQIGDRVTDADERLGILELDSEDEATDSAASSENGEQRCSPFSEEAANPDLKAANLPL
jgi:hypothetical protein